MFQQDAEWARVTTTTDTFLCRAVIITCPPHLAGQCASPTSVDSLNEILTDAEGKYPPLSLRQSNVANCAAMPINLRFSQIFLARGCGSLFGWSKFCPRSGYGLRSCLDCISNQSKSKVPNFNWGLMWHSLWLAVRSWKWQTRHYRPIELPSTVLLTNICPKSNFKVLFN